jgi:hypothetical protein
MKSVIVDTDAIMALSPIAISAFARRIGWENRGRYRDHADLFFNKTLDAETIFPRTSQLVDYASIVSNLLNVFSDQLGRDQEDIYQDLLTAEYDVFRIRALSAHDDGTIGIESGIDLIEQAKETMLAAACATASPQPVYRAGANKEASDFLSTVRLGQTQHGSYVVNLLNRVPPLLQQSMIQDWPPMADEPIERKVSRSLASALSALRKSAEEVIGGNGLESFENYVQEGVSANICEALSRMIQSVDTVELSLNWADTRPVPLVSTIFRFDDSDGVIFREAARKLREKRPRSNVTLYGVVNKLTRSYDADDGLVTFKTNIDGQIQSVTAVLDQSNYNEAVSAHRSKYPVIVGGDLERVGSRWRLTSASIQVIEVTADEEDQESDSGAT